MKPPVLYVAGPFQHPDLLHGIEANIIQASRAALEGWRKGWAVISPHKNCAGFQHIQELGPETWIAGDLAFIERMDPGRGDALLLLPGWQGSRGTRQEVLLARRIGLQIFQLETDGIPEVTR